MNIRQDLTFKAIVERVGDALRRARLTPTELVFLIAAVVFAAIVAFFYFAKVQPLTSALAAEQAREQELTNRLAKFNTEEKKRAEQATNAEKILDSLSRFEGMLKPDERGMTQIINEIDALGKTHKVLIGDASYRVIEPEPTTDENGNPLTPKQTGKDKKLEIYPTLGIDTTVVGDYPNLRKFLAELERSRQFLIINSLAFQGGDDKVARQLAKSGKQIQLSPDALPVSLKIGLDTYFQPASQTGK